MKDDLNVKKNKIYRKRAIKSILLLLLTILLFVTATYAWFTDT